MIDRNRFRGPTTAGRLGWLLGCTVLVLAGSLAAVPLTGALAAGPSVAVPPEPAGESVLAVALARNTAQIAAVRKERDSAREKLYAMRRRFDKTEAVVALRRVANEASEAYEKLKNTDPDVKAARDAEHALGKALDALVLARIKASPAGAALIRKIADLDEKRASLSLEYAVAEVKLTHRDSSISRALTKDKEVAELYAVYRGAKYGPDRDAARAAYHAARKVAMAKIPEARALTAEMVAAKKGADAAYKAQYEAQNELRSLESRIKYDRQDKVVTAAYNKRAEAREAVEEAYKTPAIQAANEERNEAYRLYSAKIKRLMAADPEAAALQARYDELVKERRELDDEARELQKKLKAAAKAKSGKV